MTERGIPGGIAAATIAVAMLSGAGGAHAAPQILALIATDRPVALRCDAVECRAELPTLCLQPERRAPRAGRGYRLADGQSVVLSGRGADGAEVSVALGAKVRLEARRTHLTVEARIPRDVLARHGLVRPAIAVGEGVSLVPVPDARDDHPLTRREIAEASGPRRALATALVDRDAERMPAVRLTNRLINMLPPAGRADATLRRRLWARALDDARRDGIPDPALERARFNVSLCSSSAEHGRAPSVRRCLQGFNGDTMEYLNTDLEKGLKPGS